MAKTIHRATTGEEGGKVSRSYTIFFVGIALGLFGFWKEVQQQHDAALIFLGLGALSVLGAVLLELKAKK